MLGGFAGIVLREDLRGMLQRLICVVMEEVMDTAEASVIHMPM